MTTIPPDADGEITRERAQRYLALLEKYLATGEEDALHDAYEAGRAAIANGVGILDISAMHHDALAIVLGDGQELVPRLKRAQLVFAECLSSYEMARRGFQEAVLALRQINDTLEHEIHRIAHAVHDDAGQLLMMARLAISGLASDVSPASKGRLEEVTALLDQVDEQLRRLSQELRPTILDDLGLVPALRFLADGVFARGGMRVQVESAMERRGSPNVETAAYRVIQAALTNAAKHARASCVQIRIADKADQLECEVHDNGIGFDLETVSARASNKGLGLIGMRERVSAMGGSLLITSQLGRGTVVRFNLPMER